MADPIPAPEQRPKRLPDLLLDARGLEPPEPMEQVLAVLERLAPGQRLRFLAPREPFPLYALLGERGCRWQGRPLDDGSHEVLIERMEGP
jgi:uncharacterized protein (DUF2249 family)